jgi:hypothetical protein
VSGERTVVRKGAVSIEIFVCGEGPTVLMHPGFGRSARDYNDMSTRLAKAGSSPSRSTLVASTPAKGRWKASHCTITRMTCGWWRTSWNCRR